MSIGNESLDLFPSGEGSMAVDSQQKKERNFRVSGACIIMHNNADIFTNQFKEWLPVNLHIWRAFEQQALAVFRKGFKHYSARTIIHVLRHHSALNEQGGEWKINNNVSPYLARLFDLVHPECKGLWEYRETNRTERKRK